MRREDVDAVERRDVRQKSFFTTSSILFLTSVFKSNRRLRSSISRRRLARVSNQNRVVSAVLSPELFR